MNQQDTQVEVEAMEDMDELSTTAHDGGAPDMQELLKGLSPEQLAELQTAPAFRRIESQEQWDDIKARHINGEVLSHEEQDLIMTEFAIAANTVNHMMQTIGVMDAVHRRDVKIINKLRKAFGPEVHKIAQKIHEEFRTELEPKQEG